MIYDEIDGLMSSGEKAIPPTGMALAILPDSSVKELGDVDARGALGIFDRFSWPDYRTEIARTNESSNESSDDHFYSRIMFGIGRFHIDISRTNRKCKFNVEVCIPSNKNLFKIINFTYRYIINEVTSSHARELIANFFDPSPDRRRAGIENISSMYMIAKRTTDQGREGDIQHYP